MRFPKLAFACAAAWMLLPGPGFAADFAVGLTLPLSGPAAHIGAAVNDGIRAGVNQINAEGGINSRKVVLVTRDSASNPQRAVLAAKELVEERKVDVLIPEVISGLVLAVLPYTTENKVVTLSTGSAPKIGDAQAFPYSFQYGYAATKLPPAMALALKNLGGKKVGILVASNPATIATGEQLEKLLPSKFGLEIAGIKQFPVETKDLTGNLQMLRDAGADIIAFDSPSRDNARTLMVGLQTLGWNAKVVSGLSVLSGDMRDLIPAPVQAQFYAVNFRVGTLTGTVGPDEQAFLNELKKIGPINNIALSAGGRDMIWMVKYAYEKAQKEKGNVSPDSVKAVMESVSTVKDFPAKYSLVQGNPNWTPADHTTNNVDDSKMWGLVRASTPVDGMYQGEALSAK